MVVIDADGKILGRLASQAAQQLKDGDEVYIVNAEQAVVTGRREQTFEEYRERHERGNRDHGPYYPKAPDKILKRTIKGMLPDGHDGREAFKRLRTYTGNPEDLDADGDGVKSVADLQGGEYATLQEISDNM